MSSIPPEILTRLDRLERENRRWRRAAAAVLLAAGALAVMGQTGDRTMRAHRYEVVDDAGVVRAVLGLDPAGEAILSFTDPEGIPVILHSQPAPVVLDPGSGETTQSAEQRYRREGEQAERAVDNLGRRLSDILDSADQSLNRLRERN